MLHLILIIIMVCLILTVFLYTYITWKFDYWRKRNVPFIKPSFPFGTFGDVIMGRKSFVDLSIEEYRMFDGERFFGVFNYGTPVLVIRDPALVERILVTDFNIFCNKKADSSRINDEFLTYYLGGMKDNEWRMLRFKLNAAFSSSKMKQVFDCITLGADELVLKIREHQSKKEDVSAKSLSSLFSYKVIASSFFGFECNSSAADLLMKMSRKTLFKINIVDLVFLALFHAPKTVNLLYCIPSVKNILKFYKDLSLAAIETRKEAQVRRNDVLQILLDLKKGKELPDNHEDDSLISETGNGSDLLTEHRLLNEDTNNDVKDGVIIAQMFSFLSLGANTLTTALSVILFDLASKPEIQLKVQAELDEVLKKHKQIDINSIQRLKYLDAVIQESLRLNPGFFGPVRICSSRYTIPGSDVILEAGTTVMIPTYAIHLDPNNHPDPELFNPERFIDNNFRPSGKYIPFGAGPRICLVYRLVILMLKAAVAKVLCQHSLRMSPKARLPLRYNPTFMTKLQDNIWLKFEPRKPDSS